MRGFLAFLFVFPQVVSLWLCCCTFGGQSRISQIETVPEPASTACHSCCHDASIPVHDGENLAPATKTCPCRQLVIMLLDSDSTVPEPIISGEPVDVAVAYLALQPEALALPNIAPDRTGETAFHPPDLRQRYHHVLRC